MRGLKPKTVSEHQRYLDRLIYPTLGDMRLKDMTPATVRAWIGTLNARTPRINEHAYALLETIFATAVQDELLDRTPCRERMRKPIRRIGEPATLDELAGTRPAGPRSDRYRRMLDQDVLVRCGSTPARVWPHAPVRTWPGTWFVGFGQHRRGRRVGGRRGLTGLECGPAASWRSISLTAWRQGVLSSR